MSWLTCTKTRFLLHCHYSFIISPCYLYTKQVSRPPKLFFEIQGPQRSPSPLPAVNKGHSLTRPTCNIIFKWFFVLYSSKIMFSILIKKSRRKAIKIEIALFHSFGNLKGHILDHFFYSSHIRHNFPYKLIPILMSSLKYF